MKTPTKTDKPISISIWLKPLLSFKERKKVLNDFKRKTFNPYIILYFIAQERLGNILDGYPEISKL